MGGCVMELTDKEADLIASMRKSQPPPWPTKRDCGRPAMQYPHVYRDEFGVKVVKPCAGKHVGYEVYLDESLMCVCTYKKGAMSVSDYIVATKQSARKEEADDATKGN